MAIFCYYTNMSFEKANIKKIGESNRLTYPGVLGRANPAESSMEVQSEKRASREHVLGRAGARITMQEEHGYLDRPIVVEESESISIPPRKPGEIGYNSRLDGSLADSPDIWLEAKKAGQKGSRDR
jgi:hypothetical protein